MSSDPTKSLRTPPALTGTLHNPDAFEEFITFAAMPHPDKCAYLEIEKDEKTGRYVDNPTYERFGKKWGISRRTLTDWKKREDFQGLVNSRQRQWGVDRVPDVLASLYRRCLQYGMAYDVLAFLGYYTSYNPNRPAAPQQQSFGMDDIRAIVAPLSKEKQARVFAVIADAIGDAELARRSATVQGDSTIIPAEHSPAVRE